MKPVKMAPLLILTVLAIIFFPVGMFSFIAAENALMNVTVYDHGEYREHLSGADTISDFFREVGIHLGSSDRVNHSTSSPLWDGIFINILREIEFNVQIDNGEILTRTTMPGTSVEQILTGLQQEHNIPLIYDGETARTVHHSETLNFYSWRGVEQTEFTAIPYETVENRTSRVRQGVSHVRQEGVPGAHAVTTQVVYIGGVESNRAVVNEAVTKEPVYALIDVGTSLLGTLTDVTAPDFHYVRRLRMEATAYTAGYSCTGKHPDDPWYRITASGREVEHGVVAVDRNVIPLGTRLYVENYGFAIAADVGGAIRGYKIDLFMEDWDDAIRFGRRNLYVWVLD